MERWSFWDWIAYSALAIGAVILAAETGLSQSPTILPHLPEALRNPLWGFAPLAFLIGATALFIARRVGLVGSKKEREEPPYTGHPLGFYRVPSINRTDPSKADTLCLHGINLGEKEVAMEDAYVVSRMTGERLTLKISAHDAEGNPTTMLPGETNPIPPSTIFQLLFFFNNFKGIPLSDFMAKYGVFDLVLRYDGQEHRIHYKEADVRAGLSKSPRVTTRNPKP